MDDNFQGTSQLRTDNKPSSLTIGSVLNEAWSLVKGSKWPIWAIMLGLIAVAALLQIMQFTIFGDDPKHLSYMARYLYFPIITNAIIAPFYAGTIMVAIKRARGEQVSAGSGYQYCNRYLPTATVMVVVAFIASLGIIIINVPTVLQTLEQTRTLFFFALLLALFFSVLVYTFFLLSIPLTVDKKYNPSQAMANSILWVKPYWFKILLLFIIVDFYIIAAAIPMYLGMLFMNTIIMFIGICLFLLALVWLAPFLFLIQGVIYHKLVDAPATS